MAALGIVSPGRGASDLPVVNQMPDVYGASDLQPQWVFCSSCISGAQAHPRLSCVREEDVGGIPEKWWVCAGEDAFKNE